MILWIMIYNHYKKMKDLTIFVILFELHSNTFSNMIASMNYYSYNEITDE